MCGPACTPERSRCAVTMWPASQSTLRHGSKLMRNRTRCWSLTVVDLVAGSGLSFDDRGAHTLKGIPGMWQLSAVRA